MSAPVRFPVITTCAERRREPECPASVPWAMLAPHEAQAMGNHGGQSLARLADRGGLGPREMLNVLEGRTWKPGDRDDCGAIAELVRRVTEWNETQGEKP